jgi:hypothetical protein
MGRSTRASGGAIVALLALIGFATAAAAASLPANSLAGYSVQAAATDQATVSFVVLKVTCSGTSPSMKIGSAVWDGTSSVEAFVWAVCDNFPSPPLYWADGYWYDSALGTGDTNQFFAVAPGQRIVTTVTAEGASSQATVRDVTSGLEHSYVFGGVGAGTSIIGFFPAGDWNAAPAGSPAQFTRVRFSNARVDGKALGRLDPVVESLTGSGYEVTPSPLGPGGTSFTDVYST